MSYNFHFQRCDENGNVFDEDNYKLKCPITLEEWIKAVEATENIRITNEDIVGHSPKTNEIFRMKNRSGDAEVYYANRDEWNRIFWYSNGEISFNGIEYPDKNNPIVVAAIELKKKLNCKIVGDEGEEYCFEKAENTINIGADDNSDNIESNGIEEGKDVRLICGFWRRLFAFIIDFIILGILGFIVGTAFFDFFAEIGVLGLLFGFAVALLYFAIQNSSVCGGQTLGKRILNIKVVNKEAETISLKRSFIRFMVLGPPYFLNGALLPKYTKQFFRIIVIGNNSIFWNFRDYLSLHI